MSPHEGGLRIPEQKPVDDLERSEWERLQELFGQLLESESPESLLSAQVAAKCHPYLLRLWKQHQESLQSGFLGTPVSSVRALAASMPCFELGQILVGRFRIDRLLGAGGMGEVYLAYDQRLSEHVALKTIRRRLAQEPEIRRRFVAEVQSARRVTHANVCRIFELFDDGEVPFLAMEYLEGPTLSTWLEDGPRHLDLRRKVALDLAEGLAAAHSKGIIHRDFKPDNVILTGSEAQLRAVITDFGLARPFSDPDSAPGQSLGGGTRDYMAPEVKAGAPATVQSDLYAFGLVLDQLLPGNRFAVECAAPNPERRPKSLDGVIREWRSSHSRRLWLLGWVAGPAAAIAAYEWMSRPRLAVASRQKWALNIFDPGTDSLAYPLRELLISGLRQSPLVSIVSDERIRALSGGMWPRGDMLLSAARAAQIRFVLKGTLKRLPAGLRIDVEVLESLGGTVALRLGKTGDVRRPVALADQVALQLRRELGESENSLRATYRPLAAVTSDSPEAVDAYFQGQRLYESSDADGAVTWFERAIEIDPSFALAHLRHALALASNDKEAESLPSYQKAYQLRSRVSERERLWIESQYLNIAAQDLAGALNALRRLVRLFPDEPTFQRQLGLAFARVGQPLDGIEAASAAVALNPSNVNNRNVLISNYAQGGRWDDALEQYEVCRREGVTADALMRGVGLAYMGKEDYPAALAAFRKMNAPPELRGEGQCLSWGPLVLMGRFAEASTEMESAASVNAFGGASRQRDWARVYLAWSRWLMDQPMASRARLAEILQLDRIPLNLPFIGPAAALAFLLKDPQLVEQARASLQVIADRWPSTYSKGTLALGTALERWTRAEPGAAGSFHEARGLWPDPLTNFLTARWQSEQGDFEGALVNLNHIQASLGTLLQYHFAGLAVLTRIDQARCLRRLSRFSESLRLYKVVLNHWGRYAGGYGVVQAVRSEYLKTQQGAKGNG
ncbi:MAG: serine/threonine-protein kinase [Bryobacteraceae bacterium]